MTRRDAAHDMRVLDDSFRDEAGRTSPLVAAGLILLGLWLLGGVVSLGYVLWVLAAAVLG